MKKKIIIIVIFLFILIPSIIYFVSSNNDSNLLDNKINCLKEENYEELNFNLKTIIEFEHNDDKTVDKLTVIKTFTSNNQDNINSFKNTSIEDINKNKDLFGGLSYYIEEDENKIIIKEIYDFKIVNLDNYTTIYPGLINSIIDNKIYAEGLKMYYQDLKFKCD